MKKIDKKTLDILRKHVETICIITEDNLDERISKISKYQHDLYVLLAYESHELECLDIKMKEKYGILYKHYKYNDNRSWETKGEIESQIYADPKYQSLWRLYNEQLYIVKEIDGMLKSIISASYQIKNKIALLKFEAGMF